MPRIRTIKPEFWSSPDTAQASPVARLAYIAMWNWADDHGRGTANLKELEGFIFPNDDVSDLSHGISENFRDVVAEVSECFGVLFFEVNGRHFYEIPSWEKHQRNERKSKSKYPSYFDPDSVPDKVLSGNARKFRDSVTEAPKSVGLGTGEQGNRGTGEQVYSSTEVERRKAPAKKPHAYSDAFLRFWAEYPRKQDKGKAYAIWKKLDTTEHEAIVAGARRYAADPNRSDQYTKLPTSWLNARAWEDETPLPARNQGQTYEDKIAYMVNSVNAYTQAQQTPEPDYWEIEA